MWKRYLAAALSVVMLSSGVTMTAFAQTSDSAVQTEITAESDDENSLSAVEVSDAVEVAQNETAEITYELEVHESVYNYVEADVRIKGYASSSDYYSNKPGSVLLRMSEDEEFTVYNTTYSCGTSYSTSEEDGFVVTLKYRLAKKENTTYYVKASIFSVEEYQYCDLTDAVSVTTKEKPQPETSIQLEDVGAGFGRVLVMASGTEYPYINDLLYLQASEDAEFNTLLWNEAVYFCENGDEEAYRKSGLISSLTPETTYYVRLAYYEYDDDNNKYVTTPLGDAICFTTAADEMYTSDIIKDEALREVVEKGLSSVNGEKVWSKRSLEQITNLYATRSIDTDKTITDLSGLEYLVNLSSLSLKYHKITDVSVLAELPDLESVYLNENNIREIPDLSSLEWLSYFALDCNLIPAETFTAGNTGIPLQLRNSASWLKEQAKSQRTSETPGIVLADTYYNTGTDEWTIQVEADNIRSKSSYTLSVYEGDTLLAEELAGTVDSWYGVVYWLVSDIVTEPGTRTLTFVVTEDGEEVSGVTKEITFVEEDVRFNSLLYQPTDISSYYLSVWCYGKMEKPVKAELLDEQGTVVSESLSIYSVHGADEQRYSDIFAYCRLQRDYNRVAVKLKFIKWLSEGEYTIRFTFENGESKTFDEKFVITEEPVITDISLQISDYTSSVEGEYLYVMISGYNMDFDQVQPVLLNAAGEEVSVLVDRKATSTTSSVYKVKNISGQLWEESMTVKLVAEPGYVIVNAEENHEIYPGSSPNIYYSEYIPYDATIKILTQNIEDGEYSFDLSTEWNGTAISSCRAVVQDGMAILSFLNEDGSRLVFDKTQNFYEYYLTMHYGENSAQSDTITQRVENYNYGIEHRNSSDASAITGISAYYVNDGSAWSTSVILDKSVLEENSNLSAKLLDWADNEVSDIAVYFDETLVNGTDEKWLVTFVLEKPVLSDGDVYQIGLWKEDDTEEEKLLGTGKLAVLAPQKMYWAEQSISYHYTNGTLTDLGLTLSGYYPEDVDMDRFRLRLLDLDGRVVYEAAPRTWKRDENYTAGDLQRYKIKFALTEEQKQKCSEYTSLKMQCWNDDALVYDIYLTEWESTVSVKAVDNNRSAGSLRITYENENAHYQPEVSGFDRYTAEAVKILVYMPYDAEPIAELTIPADNNAVNATYMFKAEDFPGLSANKRDTRYDFVVLDSNGNFVDFREGYLQTLLPFNDLPENTKDWRYAAAKYVYTHNIMSGTGNDTFEPDAVMTRAMFVQILYNMEGEPEVTDKDIFVDVPAGAWYRKAVIWAVEEEITSGVDEENGLFGSDMPINREQLATLLYNYAVAKDYDVSGRTDLSDFNDDDRVSEWAMESIQWAVNAEIISGIPQADGTLLLAPKAETPRIQCATMISNFCQKYVDIF